MRKNKLSYTVFVIVCVIFIACSSKDNVADKEKVVTPSKYIKLSQKQLDLMDIELGEVQSQILKPIIYANGKMVPLPNSEASVSSVVAGKIERINLLEGQRVVKGQVLFVISGLEIVQIQQDYLNLKNELKFLQLEYNRQSELNKNNVGALADFQLSESKFYQAQDNLKALATKLNLIGINIDDLNESSKLKIASAVSINSPIDGFLLKLPVNVGMQVSPGLELARVVSINDLHAEVFCYEKDIDLIEENQDIEVEFANKNIQKTTGKITYINRSVDTENKAVTLHIKLSNYPVGVVLPYMSLSAKINSKKSDKKVTTVPLSAIYEESKVSYIFHTIHAAKTDKDENYYFKKVKVNVIASDGSNAEIRLSEELPPDAKVVIHNTFALEVESRKLGGE